LARPELRRLLGFGPRAALDTGPLNYLALTGDIVLPATLFDKQLNFQSATSASADLQHIT
jgi:hypothetical protein